MERWRSALEGVAVIAEPPLPTAGPSTGRCPELADGPPPSPHRWEVSPPGLDEQEIAWWEEFSAVEHSFCWVQTPLIQRMIRGRYVRSIARSIPRGGAVLELGCGTGWLALLLARYGAAEVHGVDFSPEQIRRAGAACQAAGLSQLVRFHLLTGSLAELPSLTGGRKFDAVVIHGTLHHLTNHEIRTVFAIVAGRLCKSGARLFALEPVFDERVARPRAQWLIRFLTCLPNVGQSLGLRRTCKAEQNVLATIRARSVGVPPRGPSPKEMPFRPGEVEPLARPHWRLRASRPALLFSFHAARNLLLLKLSHPVLGALVTWPYLWLVRWAERLMLSRRPWTTGSVVFELLEFDLEPTAVGGVGPANSPAALAS
jgi:ubiquinone/menaquinone biosynthesis C-methylase UbiE